MKKIYIFICLVLTLLSLFVLAACGEEESSSPNNDRDEPSSPNNGQGEPCPDGRHEFSEWKTEKEAFCDELGLQSRTCLICKVYKEQQRVKNTTNHEYENYICKRCGHSISPVKDNFVLSADGTYYILSSFDVLELKEYTIPSEYEGKPVKEIGKGAFKGLTDVEKIIFPESIEKIDDGAFEGCIKLKNVVIPNTVKHIGYGAFNGCYNIETLEVPFVGMNETSTNAVIGYIFGAPLEDGQGIQQTVGDKVLTFWISPKLIEVKVTGGELYDRCFENCTNIKRVIYTGKGVSVGDRAFDGCVSLDSVSFPISVYEYGERAFQNCIELDIFPLNEGIEKIGAFCFAGCSTDYTASTFELPSTLTSVGEGAFSGCNFIKTVIIPANVERLPNYMFQNCKALESITLQEPRETYEIKSIGRYCFSGCSKLSSVTISSTVEEIRNLAFYGCHSLTSINIPSGMKEICDEAFKNCSILAEVTIEEGLEKISKKAFEDCTSLKSITLPASLEEIEENAFLDCANLKEFIVRENSEFYSSEDGNIYSAGKTTLVLVAPAFAKADLIIPEGVTSIEASAFAYTTFVTNIHLPSTLRSVNDKAFYFNPSVKSVSFLGDIEIGNYSFAGCPNLESVTLKGVNKIGEYAFSQCPKLKTVVMDDATNILTAAFFACPALTDVTVSNVELLGEYAFSECTALKNVDITNNVLVIGEGVFNKCSALEEIKIGAQTTVIGEFAFFECTSLKTVTLEEGLISIKEACFEGCSALEEIYFPATLESINAYAFKNCNSLTKFSISFNNPNYAVTKSIYLVENDLETGDRTLIIVAPAKIEEEMTLPDSITAINKYVFRHATQLKKVYLPESLKVIGEEAFFDTGLTEIDLCNVESIGAHAFGQTKLTSVTIPESVKTIDEYAFQYCYDLKEFYIRSTVEKVGTTIFHGVGTEESKLYVYVDFERGEAPSGWSENWLKGCVYNPEYGYVFE